MTVKLVTMWSVSNVDPSQAWTEGRKYLVHTHTLTFGRTELFVIDDKGQHRVWAGMLTRFVKSGDTVQEETVTEEPAKEVKKGWEPDTIREDIDIMESIRRASNRF